MGELQKKNSSKSLFCF